MTDVAWVALSLIRGMGSATLNDLAGRFGGAAGVFNAADADLLAVPRVGRKTLAAIRETDLHAVAADLDRWQAAGAGAVVLGGAGYPSRLAPPHPEPPAVLFVRGAYPAQGEAVAVIGTRHPSPPMHQTANQLGRLLAAAGYVVVSGLALGVDAAAHRGALAVPTGRTVAVLGGGVLNVYPEEHQDLAAVIVERGALVCEVQPEATVSTPGLVARNRIISGLSDAVIVVESSEDGGAMHAARAAYKQGRQLIAVDNTASGNRKLIDDGHAHPLQPDLTNLPGLL